MLSRIFLNILILLVGPLLTIFVYLTSKGEIKDWWVIVIMVLVFSVITVAIATKVYSPKKTVAGSIGKSYLASLASYTALASIFILIYDPPGAGWLIVIIPFMLIFTSPMALSISYGTIKILSDIRNEKQMGNESN